MTTVQMEKFFLDQIKEALNVDFVEDSPSGTRQNSTSYNIGVKDAKRFIYKCAFHSTSSASKAKALLRKKFPDYQVRITNNMTFALNIQPSAKEIHEKRQAQVVDEKNEVLLLQSTAQESQTSASNTEIIKENIKKIEIFISSSNLQGRGVIIGIIDFKAAMISGTLNLDFNRSENAESNKEVFFTEVGLLPIVQESSWIIDLTATPHHVNSVEEKKVIKTEEKTVVTPTPTPTPPVASVIPSVVTSPTFSDEDWMKARKKKNNTDVKKRVWTSSS